MSFSKLKVSFSTNFVSLFSVMKHNFSALLKANQSTELLKFQMSSQKSEILHFDGLIQILS